MSSHSSPPGGASPPQGSRGLPDKAAGVETLATYLEHLASDAPVPGGGSAAPIVAASGAALVTMVARICSKSQRYAEYHGLARTLAQRADALRKNCLTARTNDETAFSNVVRAQALPNASDSEKQQRSAALETALTAAAAAPLQAAKIALEIQMLSAQLLTIPNPNLVSDIGCAAEFSHAAVMACGYNVRINHSFMHDANVIAHQVEEIARYERKSSALLAIIRSRVRSLKTV